MIKLVSALLLTAATIATPALANPATSPIAFQRAGIRYVGTVTNRDDGSSLIAGHEVDSGRAFELTVANGLVKGTYDNQQVSYDAPRTKRAKPSTTASVAVAGSNTGM